MSSSSVDKHAPNDSSNESLVDESMKLQRRLFTPFLLRSVPSVPLEQDRPLYPDYPKYTKPIEWIFFTWMLPVLKTGYKRTLQPADLFELNEHVKVQPLAEKFHRNFQKRLAQYKTKHIQTKAELRSETTNKSSVLKNEEMLDFEPGPGLSLLATLDTFRLDYFSAVAFMAAALAVQTTEPLLSKRLINYVTMKSLGVELNAGKGVGFAIGVSAMTFFTGICINHAFYLSTFTGARMRGVLTKLILDKSFKLSARSRKKYPASKITSIMSTDVSRIDLGLGYSLWTVAFPIPICIAIGILIYNIRVPALVGVALMVAYLVFAAGMGTLLYKYRTKALKQTDARVALVKEVLNNLKIIKLYSWEIPYFNMIFKTRTTEMRFLLKMEVVRSVIISAASSLTAVSSWAAFLVLYAIASETKRNPATIFSSVALFAILSNALTVLPLSLASVVDAVISMGRISSYLSAEEDPVQNLEFRQGDRTPEKAHCAILCSDASFEWEIFEDESEDEEDGKTEAEKADIRKRKLERMEKKKSRKRNERMTPQVKVKDNSAPFPGLESSDFSEKGESSKKVKKTFRLGPISLQVQHGEFLAITGQIGSGKSSLLLALAGTMKSTGGLVSIGGDIILCGTPWVQNATVQENILFGLPYDREWYQQVIFSTCLQADLDILPAGDQTEVGERGITISGGQKARLCLARAVYANPSILLLDDVLSAVDAKVGQHIMDHCITGLLRNTTVILATHQLSLVSSANRVAFMELDGKISIGLLEELMDSNLAFKDLMQHNTHFGPGNIDIDGAEDIYEDNKIELDKSRSFKKEDGVLVSEEEKSVNAIGIDVVSRYICTGARGFGFNWIIIVALTLTVLHVFFELFQNTWLSFWVEYKFGTKTNGWYIGLYTCFVALSVIFNLTSFASVIYIMNRASRILNIEACRRVFYVPMSFMDVTPMGRIINRFTKDTDVLDSEMGDKVALVTLFSAFLSGILILCIIFLPWIAFAIPVLAFFFFLVAGIYQASGREIKRLEAIQRSKVYNNFNESLTGMETIKIYGKTDRFLRKNADLINIMNEAYYLSVANQRWLDIAITGLMVGFVLILTFLCVFKVFKISPASVGLLLSYIFQAAGLVSMLIVIFTQVEQDMNSAERILEYVEDLPQEAPYIIADTTPLPSWPEEGKIVFEDVDMVYRPGLPLVLKKFTATIGANEKIGICGRTGAGKSSIMTALYRLTEMKGGSIHIDGVNISTLGLKNLRSRLSIIPQDSVLFDGTIRKNLDPFGEKTDDELWSFLRRTNIIPMDEIDTVKKQLPTDPDLHQFHLDRVVEDEGANFSLGERQLVSFARALVRNTKILVLDEATSSVDYATDKKIQDAIVSEFSHCTILCIAHRLKTILKYDRVIVMDKGEIVEFDTPKNLFHLDGYFRQMCNKTGITAKDF
ncbi:hypothetical protein PUMCH_003916 [Australozyma saopauloensis]|uniref:Oligomycin resistance ATP-dependent permease YOR1 n=1 Tax=Australozyma saopauloensis TaxID=291208 RepID=A0AAX4HD55_9ASCO|nr:hypothetical protein PUMCH_003916 [[Candida] saopauloensis]